MMMNRSLVHEHRVERAAAAGRLAHSVTADDWEHPDDCPAAWTIECRHDGTVVAHHCPSCRVDPTAEAEFRAVLAEVTVGAREAAQRRLLSTKYGSTKEPRRRRRGVLRGSRVSARWSRHGTGKGIRLDDHQVPLLPLLWLTRV